MDDPDDENVAAFDYKSVFTYERPDYFAYGKPNKDKYQSAFTYQGVDPNDSQKIETGKYKPNQNKFSIGIITMAYYDTMAR